MDTTASLSPTKVESLFDKIEKLPQAQRILISAGIFLLIIGAFIYFSFLPKSGKIGKLEKKLEKLEKQVQTAKRNAASLKKFEAKMKEAEIQFKAAMRALPEKEEIPSLLTSISKSGQDVGLEFLLFEPKPEIRKDFYAEIPVAMNVKGGYHDLAIFFDKVARLSRIVNIRDIRMGREKEGADLNTTCTAVTYKFVEPQPEADVEKKKKKTRKKK
jgi:type IV pilus assembly protein PilO